MTDTTVPHLTVSLGLWPLERSDPFVHRDLLQEGVALWLREVWSLQLAKVELHGTVVADDVGEEGLALQTVLADLESHSGLATVLGEGYHKLIALKVLSKKSRVQSV